MNSAPRSTTPPANGSDHTRPPTRSRASNTVTSRPARASSSAAASPAKPAPTTTTRRSSPLGSLLRLDLPAREVGDGLAVALLVQRTYEHAVRREAEGDEHESPEALSGDDGSDDANQRDDE